MISDVTKRVYATYPGCKSATTTYKYHFVGATSDPFDQKDVKCDQNEESFKKYKAHLNKAQFCRYFFRKICDSRALAPDGSANVMPLSQGKMSKTKIYITPPRIT